MLARVDGSALVGMEAHRVGVEVDVMLGIPAFEIVGLPDTGIRESRIRVKSAIRNSGYEFPNRRIHVNLSPADLKKEGPSFDLPLALAILQATGQLRPARPAGFIAAGELSLDGRLREVPGALSISLAARECGAPFLLLPAGNTGEAALVEGVCAYGVSTLRQAASFLEGTNGLAPAVVDAAGLLGCCRGDTADLSEVKGQEAARRALEVAAAGGHNMLMVGPPGSGKTMLARRLPGILPPLTFPEALEITRVRSVAGLLGPGETLVSERPFRDPHHSTSAVGLTGGGSPLPRPGEVSLAHGGVLYLDEMALFARNALESLRGPVEDGRVTVIRSMVTVTFPSSFSLVASMNPCPCGFLGDPERECSCAPGDLRRYASRISGPLMDRMDIQVRVPRLTRERLLSGSKGECSTAVGKRVAAARGVQEQRLQGSGVHSNARMTQAGLEEHCRLDAEAERFLAMAVDRLGLSARSVSRVLKVARTIADLDGEEGLQVQHIAEAVQYRCLDGAPRG